jgi:hypothetical protein
MEARVFMAAFGFWWLALGYWGELNRKGAKDAKGDWLLVVGFWLLAIGGWFWEGWLSLLPTNLA